MSNDVLSQVYFLFYINMRYVLFRKHELLYLAWAHRIASAATAEKIETQHIHTPVPLPVKWCSAVGLSLLLVPHTSGLKALKEYTVFLIGRIHIDRTFGKFQSFYIVAQTHICYRA